MLDQPHSITALASGAGQALAVRRPVPLRDRQPVHPGRRRDYDPAEDEYRAIDGPLLSERLPVFWQLDLRLDREWKRRGARSKLYIDVQNVTNHRSPEGVTYNEDFTVRSYTRGLPVFPSIGVEYVP